MDVSSIALAVAIVYGIFMTGFYFGLRFRTSFHGRHDDDKG